MATKSQDQSLSTSIIQEIHDKEVKLSSSTVTYTCVYIYVQCAYK